MQLKAIDLKDKFRGRRDANSVWGIWKDCKEKESLELGLEELVGPVHIEG